MGMGEDEVYIYILSISFQLAGALLLVVFAISTKRQATIKRFAGKGIIARDGNSKELSYNENEFKETFRIGYVNKCAFMYIAIGYFGGVFGNIDGKNKIVIGLLVLLCTAFLMGIAYVIIEQILKKSKKVNQKITNEELEKAGIKPDMESISNAELEKLLDSVENESNV